MAIRKMPQRLLQNETNKAKHIPLLQYPTWKKLLLCMADAWAGMSYWHFSVFIIKYWLLTFGRKNFGKKKKIKSTVFFSLKKGRGVYANRRLGKNGDGIGSSKISPSKHFGISQEWLSSVRKWTKDWILEDKTLTHIKQFPFN